MWHVLYDSFIKEIREHVAILNDVEIFIKNFQKTPRKKFIADINGSKKSKIFSFQTYRN